MKEHSASGAGAGAVGDERQMDELAEGVDDAKKKNRREERPKNSK